MYKPRLDVLFPVSDTRRGGDYIVGRVVRLERSGEILGADMEKMILDRKHFIFLVRVIDRGHLNAAGGYADDRVLNILESLNQGW